MKLFKNILFKIFICIILVLVGSIVIKRDISFKNIINQNIYNNYINFAYLKKKYINYLLIFQDTFKDKKVFNESIKYSSINKYNNGVKVKLDDNLVFSLSDGIIVNIKDNMVILETSDGVEEYYSNLDTINIKLYDYISKNELIGSALNNELYLEFKKDNKYLDYKEFLK